MPAASGLMALVACASIIGGCSSKIGSHESAAAGSGPQAVITPIGHKATQSNGTTTLTVRSGADVVLSAKDTVNGSAALTSFAWTQNSSDTPQVNLIYRTSNTVSFTAPTVAQATPINLVLTVKDAHGNNSTAKATVNVQPVGDAGQFFTTPVTNPTPRTFQVAIVPQQDLNLSADTSLCISVSKTINYLQRGTGTASTAAQPFPLPATRLEVKWLQAVTPVSVQHVLTGMTTPDQKLATNAAIASFTNPRVTFDVPIFNDEDLFVRFNQPQGANRPPALEPTDAAAARVAQQLIPADVDSASLSLSLTAVPGTCDNPQPQALNNIPLVMAIIDSDDNSLLSSDPAPSPAIPTLKADDLHSLLQGVNHYAFAETTDTAKSYYHNIDPIGDAARADQSLNKWLDANCFNSKAPNYGADTHAVYTNNFDLGFGRDMYFVTCTQANLSAGRNVGDSASVVVNYPSLESAVLKQNLILAVAMSHNAYAASGTAAQRFTKFFAFAPDDRDGNLYLVRSVNFDRRGQRYLPGACTMCHGGTLTQQTVVDGQPASAGASAITAGDVDAAFMPWDEGALLFSDNDPAYTGSLVPKAGYTQSEQAASIYALNQHAYATYLSADPHNTRFDASKALIRKWYGDLPGGDPQPGTLYSDIHFQKQTFDDSGFPDTQAKDAGGAFIAGSGWNEENQTYSDDLYHKVFSHQCRACHAQMNDTTDPKGTFRFNSYGDFKALLQSGTPDIANIPNLLYHNGSMPLAALTDERFWVNYDGGDSPATLLARHAATLAATDNTIDGSIYDASSKQAQPPGAPAPLVSLNSTIARTLTASGGSVVAPRSTLSNPGQFVRIDATQSLFVNSYQWTLCLQSSQIQNYSGPLCPTPLSLVGSHTAIPAFETSSPGTYALSLAATDASGKVTPSAYTASIVVNKTPPSFANCALQPHTPITSLIYPISLSCASAGDGANQLLLAPDNSGSAGTFAVTLDNTHNSTACATSTLQQSVPANPTGLTACDGASYAGWSSPKTGTVYFQFDPTATSAQTMWAQLTDGDGDSASYKFSVGLDSTGTAANAQYPVNLPASITLSADGANSQLNASACNGTSKPLSCSYTILPTTAHFDLTVQQNGSAQGVLTARDSGGQAWPNNVISGATLGGSDTLVYQPSVGYLTCDSAGNLIPAGNLLDNVRTNGTTPVVPSTACTAADGERFTYQITLGTQTFENPPTAISMQVKATQSFVSTVHPNLGSQGCGSSSCHGTPGGVPGTAWHYVTDIPTTYGNIVSTSCHGPTSSTGVLNGTQFNCVIAGQPDKSLLYTNMCNNSAVSGAVIDSNHGINFPRLVTSHAACTSLYQWILEGAAFD